MFDIAFSVPPLSSLSEIVTSRRFLVWGVASLVTVAVSSKLIYHYKYHTEPNCDKLDCTIKKTAWHVFEFINQVRKEQRMCCRPERIILIRHGESEGNKNPVLYSQLPDHRIQLTEAGKRQAKEAGRKLKNLVGDEYLYFYYSPFLRCKETTEYICQGVEDLIEPSNKEMPLLTRVRSDPNFPLDEATRIRDEIDPLQPIQYHREQTNGQIVALVEDPRLREQEWGNLQIIDKMGETDKLRNMVGRFYYRFPTGEAGSDVFDRVSSFLQSLYRNFLDGPFCNKPEIKWNVVIVSHGLFMRLFLHRYFRWTVDEFEQVSNFGNCDMCVLRKKHTGPAMGSYRLETALPKLRPNSPSTDLLLQRSVENQPFGYNRLGDVRKQDYDSVKNNLNSDANSVSDLSKIHTIQKLSDNE